MKKKLAVRQLLFHGIYYSEIVNILFWVFATVSFLGIFTAVSFFGFYSSILFQVKSEPRITNTADIQAIRFGYAVPQRVSLMSCPVFGLMIMGYPVRTSARR